MNSYISFLFKPDGTLKPRTAPVVNTIAPGRFVLKYSVPGYHSPRQYFSFSDIPDSFPNDYVAEIFRVFSINNSFLFRNPHNRIPAFKKSIINEFWGIKTPVRVYSEEEIETARYNLNLAIELGRSRHSLFYFDNYLEAFRILHPELRYSQNVVKKIQADFNKLISC